MPGATQVHCAMGTGLEVTVAHDHVLETSETNHTSDPQRWHVMACEEDFEMTRLVDGYCYVLNVLLGTYCPAPFRVQFGTHGSKNSDLVQILQYIQMSDR